MKEKIFNLVGLARRAGKVAVGTSMLEKMLARKKVALIIFAEDATQNTINNILQRKPACSHLVFGTKDEWGQALGRKQVAVLGIIDPNFVHGILANLHHQTGKENGGNEGDGVE